MPGSAIRFVKPSNARWLKAFGITLLAIYVVSIPTTWLMIDQAGMGGVPGKHHPVIELLVAFLMLTVLWAPLMCVWSAPVLVPLAALIAYVGAAVHRARADDE